MIRHQSFYNRNEDNLTIANALKESLEERIYEHIVSIECAWGQRIHSAACHGFYCGYRAALNLIDDIKPLDSSRMIQHTLLLEYHLGYIGSYEEMERRTFGLPRLQRTHAGHDAPAPPLRHSPEDHPLFHTRPICRVTEVALAANVSDIFVQEFDVSNFALM